MNGKSERVERLIMEVHDILSNSSLTFLANLSNRVKDLFTKFRKSEIVIPLVGEFSSGKSSLLNALLRKEILPTDVLPTTSIVNEVRFSCEKSKTEIIYSDGKKKEIDGLVNLKESNLTGVSLIRICSSSDIVPYGVVIADIPGLSSGIDEHGKVIIDYVPKADAIFLVVSAIQGGVTDSTKEFLEKINAFDKKIYLIITKADLKSQRELEDIKNYAKKEYNFTIERIIITSAKENRIEEFISLIREIHSSKSEILVENCAADVKLICENAIALIDKQLSLQNLDTKEIDVEISKLNEILNKGLKVQLEKELEKTRNKIKEVEEKTVKIFEDELMKNLDVLVKAAFSDEKDKLEKKFNAVLEKAAIKAIAHYQKALNVVYEELYKELETMVDKIGVDARYFYMHKVFKETFTIVLFTGLLGSLTLGIIVRLLTLLFTPIKEILDGIAGAAVKLLSKSFVENQIKKAMGEAVKLFKTELEQISSSIFEEEAEKIRNYYEEQKETHAKSLETLKQEKSKKEEEYRKYVDLLTKASEQLRRVREELNTIIRTL